MGLLPHFRHDGRHQAGASVKYYAFGHRIEMARRAVAIGLAVSVWAPNASAQNSQQPPTKSGGAWTRFAAGFATSILAHEGGHVVAALVQGAHPTFGLDHGRPTIFSGIDPYLHPHEQLAFSSAGLNVQTFLDEGILDDRGGVGSFKRGMLAGGIATVAFYLTIGRTARVSDIAYIRRTSGLTASQIDLIYGGVALMHVVRIARDGRFADFFVRPDARGDVLFGVQLH